MLVINIALGIWLGGLFLLATLGICCAVTDKIQRNKRLGYSWWHNSVMGG